MKKYLLVFFLITYTLFLKGQNCFYNGVFLSSYYDATMEYFEKDTNGLWEVGSSDKLLLNFSGITIMTDTINSYPSNSNSSFQLKIPAGLMDFNYLSFYYKTNTDTLTDYGKIEISINNGNTWLDIDSLLGVPPIILTGNNSWGQQTYDFPYSIIPGFFPNPCDTIRYKFSFFSDSIDTNKEGIQFYGIQLLNYSMSINDNNSNNNSVLIYPNPSTDEITLTFEQTNSENTQIEIQNLLGQTVYSETLKTNIGKQTKSLDASMFQNGVYFIQLKNQDKIYSTKFIKK